MMANLAQTRAWAGKVMAEGAETVITALPLYHVFSLTANLLLFLNLGGTNVLVANPRDLAGFVKTLRGSRFTAITGVNTLYRALLDAPGFDAVCAANRGRLKLAVAGGMAVQRIVAERWQEATGAPLVEGYGLTEASPNLCANPPDAREFSGTLGSPLPGTEIAIMDEAGRPLPAGEVGEICARGAQVMRGYWNAPEETARAFFPGGWLRTGDLGRLDARGHVEFVERRKEVIVVSGFKAYPGEIETIAMRHPGVLEAGAAAIPDPKSGEAVALYVVRRDPALDEKTLLEHCAQHLAPYKRPVRVFFRDALPKSPIGKVLRRLLQPDPGV
jgi:long-chain acyl-CoA synthetase